MKTLLAALLLVSVSSPLRAADAVLEKLQGKVFVLHPGDKRFSPAQAGQELSFGDSLQTHRGALAQVVFNDGAAVLVKEKSAFSLRGHEGKAWVAFKRGEFLIGLRKKLSRGQSFRVWTPAAVAAVRGTLFWGKSDEKKDSTYAAFENRIVLSAQGKSVTLEPGQTAVIPFGQAPGAPEASKIPASYLQTFAVDGSIQGLDELLKK